MDRDSLGHAGDFGALAHYSDPQYYDLTYGERKHDVAYYVTQARSAGDGRVLEYGCGSGRITLPMAQAKASVTAVDLSAPMLSALSRRLAEGPKQLRDRISLHRADMRAFETDERFSLILAPFNTLLHLYEPEEMFTFLAKVRKHLAKDGRFIFDISVPQPADLGRDPTEVFESEPFIDPTTGVRTGYDERFEYDPIRQLLVVWMRFTPEDGTTGYTIPLCHRQYYPQEIKGLLLAAGFRDISFESDFSTEPPGPYTDSLVVTCR